MSAKGNGLEPFAHLAKYGMRRTLARNPDICGDRLPPLLNHRIREPGLAVELDRSRLHRQGARGRSWLRSLIDDPYTHAQPCQPKGQHQPCGSCADDENLGRIIHRG